MRFRVDWMIKASGTIRIEADSEEEAKKIFRSMSDFELLQDGEDVESCLDYGDFIEEAEQQV